MYRFGRIGREGKDGEGILLFVLWEEYFLDDIRDFFVERIVLFYFVFGIKGKVCIICFWVL